MVQTHVRTWSSSTSLCWYQHTLFRFQTIPSWISTLAINLVHSETNESDSNLNNIGVVINLNNRLVKWVITDRWIFGTCSPILLGGQQEPPLTLPTCKHTVSDVSAPRLLLIYIIIMIIIYCMACMHAWLYRIILEYFAGEKPLRMSQISYYYLCDLTIVFWQGSWQCVFTIAIFYGFYSVLQIDQPFAQFAKCLMLAKHLV